MCIRDSVYGVLLHEYGCHGLEGYAEVDVLSVADAALNATGVDVYKRQATGYSNSPSTHRLRAVHRKR